MIKIILLPLLGLALLNGCTYLQETLRYPKKSTARTPGAYGMVINTAPLRCLHYHTSSDTSNKIDNLRQARIAADLVRINVDLAKKIP